ncbi:MinD/ParA family ATP-binding protein [Natronomonas sp. EA1]|uniref:MinD/ParA family ATP-binding protein n=1 Tax=Natronomonas sp. EA1 TaxID=3421655 RepID=UPI003EC0AA01
MIAAVVGGKGGVGKSTVALNVAAELGGVVVDADLGMADLPESRGPDLHDVLAGRACAVEAVDESGAVDILPCGRALAGARAADPRRLVGALAAVEREYGDVLVDCAAGLSADVGLPLFAADRCLVVTRPTRVAGADALRARALARELDCGLAAVAVNRANGVGNAEWAFGAPAVAIPESERVREATSHGLPVRELDGEESEPFARLAARL